MTRMERGTSRTAGPSVGVRLLPGRVANAGADHQASRSVPSSAATTSGSNLEGRPAQDRNVVAKLWCHGIRLFSEPAQQIRWHCAVLGWSRRNCSNCLRKTTLYSARYNEPTGSSSPADGGVDRLGLRGCVAGAAGCCGYRLGAGLLAVVGAVPPAAAKKCRYRDTRAPHCRRTSIFQTAQKNKLTASFLWT
jgi:hypothetical protein